MKTSDILQLCMVIDKQLLSARFVHDVLWELTSVNSTDKLLRAQYDTAEQKLYDLQSGAAAMHRIKCGMGEDEGAN